MRFLLPVIFLIPTLCFAQTSSVIPKQLGGAPDSNYYIGSDVNNKGAWKLKDWLRPADTLNKVATKYDLIKYQKNMGLFVVTDYGATPNTSEDNDAVAINSTINAAKAAGGGIVFFPAGTYHITSRIEVTGRDIHLQGSADTYISSNIVTGDIVYAHPATTPLDNGQQDQGLQGFAIRDFIFISTVKKTSGAAIHIEWSEHALVENIRIGHHINQPKPVTNAENNFYDGIYLDKQGACHVTGNILLGTSHDGMIFTGHAMVNGGSYYGYDGTVDGNIEIWGDLTSGSSAIHIAGGVSGLRFAGAGNLVLCQYGIKVDRSIVDAPNTALSFNDFYIDSCIDYGLYFATNSANLVLMDNVWVSSMGSIVGSTATTPDYLNQATSGYPHQGGMYVESQSGLGPDDAQFNISACTFKTGWGSGIEAHGGVKWNITGTVFSYLGNGGLGGDGVYFAAGDNITISGCTFWKIGNSSRGTGIKLHSGVTKATIVGNTFTQCGIAAYEGPVHDGVNIIIDKNAGGPNAPALTAKHPSDDFSSANATNANERLTPVGNATWLRDDLVSSGSIGISGDAAKLTSASTTVAKYYVTTPARNVKVRATIGTAGTNFYIILARTNSTNDLQVNLMTGQIHEQINGAYTELAPGSGTSAAGDAIDAVLNETSITVYRNGAQIASSNAVSPSLTGAAVGLFFYQDATGTVDKFETFSTSSTAGSNLYKPAITGVWSESGNTATYTKSDAANVSAAVTNTNTGSGANASFNAVNDDGKVFNFGITSSNYNLNSFIGANSGYFYDNAPNGFAEYIEGTSKRLLVNGQQALWYTADASYTYINFSSTLSASGFGFRMKKADGTMEYKNSGGSWAGFASGGTVNAGIGTRLGTEQGTNTINNRGYEIYDQATINTTDATTTDVTTINIPDGSYGSIEVHMSYGKADLSDNGGGIVVHEFRKSNGTLTVKIANSLSGSDITGASWFLSSSSGNYVIKATGLAATTISWNPTWKVKYKQIVN